MIDATPPAGTSWHGRPFWHGLALVVLALAVYRSVAGFAFVNWDDYGYVVSNGAVKNGLSWNGAVWAFTTTFNANYIPLTWLSHMADVSLFGMWAGGHHLVNVLWHVLDTLLLYVVLRDATSASGRAFWVAALFAVHPLHVESVAWISERKDVLSTFFWLAGLWAYVRYVRRPSPARYSLVAVAFVLGLLAKPMLVTFPFTLLLFDYWPLQRWTKTSGIWPLVKEKLPLFALLPVSAALTLIAQQGSEAVSSVEAVPLAARFANAIVSLGQYLWHLPFPLHLAALYPYPAGAVAWGPLLASAAAVAALSAAALRWGRSSPYLAVGWLWFLGTLVPVIGLVQVGSQAWADRYTYVPYVGLFTAIVWLFGDLVASRKTAQRLATAAGGAVLLVFAGLAHAQSLAWRDDASLFGQVVARYPESFQGHYRLATYYRINGRWDEAVASSRKAVAAAPDRFDAWTNLGLALQGARRTDEAGVALRKACAMNPRSSAALYDLAQLEESLGHLQEAEAGYRRAVEVNPLEESSLLRLGTILAGRGDLPGARPFVQTLARLCLAGWTIGVTPRELGPLCVRVELWPEAQALLERALTENGRDAEAWSLVALARQRQHRFGPAAEAYEHALALEPRMAGARFNLGVARLQTGDVDGAMQAYDELVRLDPATAGKLMELIRQEQSRPAGTSTPPRREGPS